MDPLTGVGGSIQDGQRDIKKAVQKKLAAERTREGIGTATISHLWLKKQRKSQWEANGWR